MSQLYIPRYITVSFYTLKFQQEQMFYLGTLCLWINSINLPNQQIKDINTRSFTINKLLLHRDQNELRNRRHQCHLW